jgi:hypothetical protein
MSDVPDFTIITAWYDVREKENHPLKDKTTDDHFCSMTTYFDKARLFFAKPWPMVIFTEPRFENIIKEARPPELHHLTRFIFKDYEELAYYYLFDKFQENHHKNEVINLDKTKFTPLYKFVVNQKTNFVKEVAEFNPFNTTRFAWMDLRLHCVYDMNTEDTIEAISNIQPDKVKIMFQSYLHASEIWDRFDFYSWTRGKVAAGFFGGQAKPLIEFARLCQKEFVQAINEHMSPSDEMIYAYVTANNNHLFEPYVGEYCDVLRNMRQARNSNHLVLPFLYAAISRENHPFIAALSENIRRGFLNNQFYLTSGEIQTVWFRGFVSNYFLGQHDKCKEILTELIELHKQNPEIPIQNGREAMFEMARIMGFPQE